MTYSPRVEAMFLMLFVAHLVGDFLVQTDHQAANKTTSWRANQAHMLTYHLTLYLSWILYAWQRVPGYFTTIGWSSGFNLRIALCLLFVSWPIHSLLDRRWPVKWLMRHTRHSAFAETTLGVLMWDQILHVLTLWLICLFFLGV